MIVLSIDCGIKNLAFCVYDTSNKKILLWKNVNTIEEADCSDIVCKENNKNGKVCNKKGKYRCEDGKFVCKRHCKNCQNLESNTLFTELKNVKSMNILDKCAAVAECLKRVYPELRSTNFDNVYIENQPRFNPSLKNISMLIFSFFIIKEHTNIKFINAKLKNKIKGLPTFGLNPNSYRNRKKLAVLQTKHLLEINNSEYLTFFEQNKKQDDLCDSFLQALV